MEQSNNKKSGSDIIILYGVHYHKNLELLPALEGNFLIPYILGVYTIPKHIFNTKVHFLLKLLVGRRYIVGLRKCEAHSKD